jgi:hypothetical protein
MREYRKEYTVRKTARIFGVSGNVYYRRVKYGVSERRREAGAEPANLIRRIVDGHHRRWTSKK